nr:MAG TPA: hypothetical protein [Caudoviricetes sp.]
MQKFIGNIQLLPITGKKILRSSLALELQRTTSH